MIASQYDLTAFQSRLKDLRERDHAAWEHSRVFVSEPHLPETLRRLSVAVRETDLPDALKVKLAEALTGGSPTEGGVRTALLKALTGLPASKALRSLCLLCRLSAFPAQPLRGTLTPSNVETFLRDQENPYDLLLATNDPSLLDLGAGDLSFAAELADHYAAPLAQRGARLRLHCVDRLRPGSHLGGRLQVNPRYAERLVGRPGMPSPRALEFRFFGDQDMFALDRAEGIRDGYTIVTCHGPATPTFAYEPTRVARRLIEQDLRTTKGEFRLVLDQGEEALEVRHGGRSLLFPAWKFDVRGPLALLDLVAHRGALAVLTAIDSQVFWEILSQLVEDDGYRPPDVIFTREVIPQIFGRLYMELTTLRPGIRLDLSSLTPLRDALPVVGAGDTPPTVRFRYAEVRRGAVFPGLPSSQTARLFADMTEEETPWWLLLVPEPIPG